MAKLQKRIQETIEQIYTKLWFSFFMNKKVIPSIDMGIAFLSDEAKTHTIQKIREACTSTGFFLYPTMGFQ